MKHTVALHMHSVRFEVDADSLEQAKQIVVETVRGLGSTIPLPFGEWVNARARLVGVRYLQLEDGTPIVTVIDELKDAS